MADTLGAGPSRPKVRPTAADFLEDSPDEADNDPMDVDTEPLDIDRNREVPGVSMSCWHRAS